MIPTRRSHQPQFEGLEGLEDGAGSNPSILVFGTS